MRRRFGFTPEGEIFEISADRNASSEPKSHYVIGDSIEPTYCHVNCKTYDSKSALRAEMRARGMIELGNDRVTPKDNYDSREIHREVERVYREFGG